MRNASDVPLPPFAGNTGPQPYVPPDEPCDPKNVTWSHMATFTYMHKCSEICDAWYGLLQRNGTYNGPLKNQNAPDGKYVLEPSISCQVCRSEPQLCSLGNAACRLASGLHDLHCDGGKAVRGATSPQPSCLGGASHGDRLQTGRVRRFRDLGKCRQPCEVRN